MATAKHKFHRLVINPANQKLIDFLDELQKLAKDALGLAAQAIIEQFIYAKRPPHLKKWINQAHLENGTNELIVSHLGRELELNGLEAPDELQINTVTQQAAQQNSEKPKLTCHQGKKSSHYRNQCRQLKWETDQARNNTNIADKKEVVKKTVTTIIKFLSIPKQTIQIIKKTEDLGLSAQSVRPVAKLTIPQRNVILEQMQRTDRLLGTDDQKDKIKPNRGMHKATQMAMSKRHPKL